MEKKYKLSSLNEICLVKDGNHHFGGEKMGWIRDALNEVPLSSVLKERVNLADQRYEKALEEAEQLRRQVISLEREVSELRAKLPRGGMGDLSEETVRVLVDLFRNERQSNDVGALALRLQMERGVAEYHLERLDSLDFAKCTGGNYVTHEVYWNLTPAGRGYVVENGLHSSG